MKEKKNGELENYTSTRMLLQFNKTTSTFYVEHCPPSSEQVFSFFKGNYKKSGNQITFWTSKQDDVAQLKTTFIEKDSLHKIQCFLPIETDTLWVIDGEESIVYTSFDEHSWKKRVYWDSLFLKRYDAFVGPAVYSALAVDNYSSFGIHYDELERPIKAFLWETTSSEIKIRLKVNNHLSSEVLLENYGSYILDFGIPATFSEPIIANLKEDILQVNFDTYKHSGLYFNDWTLSGEPNEEGHFALYADSCALPLKKHFVQPK